MTRVSGSGVVPRTGPSHLCGKYRSHKGVLVLLARPTGDRYCFNRVQPRLSPWQPPRRDRRVVGSNDFLPYDNSHLEASHVTPQPMSRRQRREAERAAEAARQVAEAQVGATPPSPSTRTPLTSPGPLAAHVATFTLTALRMAPPPAPSPLRAHRLSLTFRSRRRSRTIHSGPWRRQRLRQRRQALGQERAQPADPPDRSPETRRSRSPWRR